MSFQMAIDGRIGRSGNAKGMDEGLTRGVVGASQKRPDGRVMAEIFLPEPNFRDWLFKNVPNHRDSFLYIDPSEEIYCRSQVIAESVHPNWNAVMAAANKGKDFALKAHSRNPFQILGRDLEKPSDYVILFAEPVNKGKAVKGGTNTAYCLARERGIRTYNLWHEKNQDKVLDYLSLTRKDWLALAGK